MNKNSYKDYYEIFEMFIVSFLNAVFVEIPLYKGKIFKDKNSIKNPEKAIFFYKKLEKEYQKEEEYTLFEYLNECPLLNSGSGYSQKPILSWTFLKKISLKMQNDN